jgi:hypothetical protein
LRKLSNNMWHTTCMHVNQSDPWLLMVGNQVDTLIPNPSFEHNLCFKYLNESCKFILDIYVSWAFQWYKEFFNPMNCDPWNLSLNIRDFIKIPIPKVGIHLGVCELIHSHILTLQECKCDFWVAFLAHTFPCLCLGRKPKIRVIMTQLMLGYDWKL